MFSPSPHSTKHTKVESHLSFSPHVEQILINSTVLEAPRIRLGMQNRQSGELGRRDARHLDDSWPSFLRNLQALNTDRYLKVVRATAGEEMTPDDSITDSHRYPENKRPQREEPQLENRRRRYALPFVLDGRQWEYYAADPTSAPPSQCQLLSRDLRKGALDNGHGSRNDGGQTENPAVYSSSQKNFLLTAAAMSRELELYACRYIPVRAV
ncbi:hypothetical protein IW262DRAFT_1297681 [Armillaria fumosa]|nr:hypothetical protein IW262DRAFT_1297681 [Armillaria fumosa]